MLSKVPSLYRREIGQNVTFFRNLQALSGLREEGKYGMIHASPPKRKEQTRWNLRSEKNTKVR